MQGTARSRSGLRASTGWTKARQLRQWAQTAATALAVDCCGLGGSGSRALDCNDSRQGGSGAAAGHGRGSRDDDESQGTGRAKRTTVVQGRNTRRGGGWKEAHGREGSEGGGGGGCDRNGTKFKKD